MGKVLLWIDAQLSPELAPWIADRFGVQAVAVRDRRLAGANDAKIFAAARLARVVVMTKDDDFVELQRSRGSPPQVLWVTCGNTSNARLRALFDEALPRALSLLKAGESLVEIGDAPKRRGPRRSSR